jgi:hypothetical protein
MIENQQYGEALSGRIHDKETTILYFHVALIQRGAAEYQRYGKLPTLPTYQRYVYPGSDSHISRRKKGSKK